MEHPREALDTVCIADIGTWAVSKMLMHRRLIGDELWARPEMRHSAPESGGVEAMYMRWMSRPDGTQRPNPLYNLIGATLNRVAIDMPSAQPFARYWQGAKVVGTNQSARGGVTWPLDAILPEDVRSTIDGGRMPKSPEWAIFYW